MLKNRQVSPFTGGWVIVIEVIQADDPITTLKQLFSHMAADETGCAGHQDFHRCDITSNAQRTLGDDTRVARNEQRAAVVNPRRWP